MLKLFSVDDHIVEPADVWSSRVSARFRDVAPHVIDEDGKEIWVYEETRHLTMGLNAVAGKRPEDWNTEPARFSDMIPGCYDPVARARDMAHDGIMSSVCFPTLPRFGGVLFSTFKDKDLALECVRAYNDFMLDEWCAAAPQMFVPMTIVPIWDARLAAQELERCLEKGTKALCFPEETSILGLPSFYTDFYDPVWSTCQDADIPVCMHIGSSGYQAYQPPDAPYTVTIALGQIPSIVHSVGMMMSPVPRKFPAIKLVYSEGGIGWVPSALERADRQFDRHRFWGQGDDLLPSEVCKRNMWFCMIEEPIGLKSRYDIGVDHIVWESDYPHADTPWPHSQEAATSVFEGIPDDEVRKITHANAEALFKWSCPDPDELTIVERVPAG